MTGCSGNWDLACSGVAKTGLAQSGQQPSSGEELHH